MGIFTKKHHSPRLYALSFFLLTSSIGHSADTDLFLSRTPSVLPNVMFSVDTSSSMASRQYVPPEYNPNITYTGNFATNQFYITGNGTTPQNPSGVSTANLSVFTDGCQFANAPVTDTWPDSGVHQWLPINGVDFDQSHSGDMTIECADDSGVHGQGASTYASSSSASLYSSNQNEELNWVEYPYVLFFSGNYLNYKQNPGRDIRITRFELQARVLRNSILRTPQIKAGLSRMWSSTGGVVTRAIKDNSDRANQQELLKVIDDLRNNDWGGGVTPLSTQLLESLHYFYGKKVNRTPYVVHGAETNTTPHANAPITDPDALVPAGPGSTEIKYQSPITSECQKNIVITVTDGTPNSNTNAYTDFRASNAEYPRYEQHLGRTRCSGECLDEIAQYMRYEDAAPDIANLYDLNGDGQVSPQTVQVYPVGMYISTGILNTTADASGTKSYSANNALEFENAFAEILSGVINNQSVSNMTASSSADRFSKTSHRDFVYYGQFAPSARYRWDGNVKKYRIAYDQNKTGYITDTDEETNPKILGPSGAIIPTAHSYWSENPDGNQILVGGIREEIEGTGNSRILRGINDAVDRTDVDVLTNDNRLWRRYGDLDAMMQLGSRSDQYDILRQVQGHSDEGIVGAVMRSTPLPIQYGGFDRNGEPTGEPRIVVFVVTSNGILHAIDDESGEELWAIAVPEAYPYFQHQYDNFPVEKRWWGIDGPIRSRIVDKNLDGRIDAAAGDKVYLYVNGGMSNRGW